MLRFLLRSHLATTRCCRNLSTVISSQNISDKLRQSLKVKEIDVQDISGGCGAMFQVIISFSTYKEFPDNSKVSVYGPSLESELDN